MPPLASYLSVAQIIVSVALILVVLLQSQGRNFSGAFSQDTSIVRTRRGLEKTLFQMTIVLGVLFVFVSIATVLASNSA